MPRFLSALLLALCFTAGAKEPSFRLTSRELNAEERIRWNAIRALAELRMEDDPIVLKVLGKYKSQWKFCWVEDYYSQPDFYHKLYGVVWYNLKTFEAVETFVVFEGREREEKSRVVPFTPRALCPGEVDEVANMLLQTKSIVSEILGGHPEKYYMEPKLEETCGAQDKSPHKCVRVEFKDENERFVDNNWTTVDLFQKTVEVCQFPNWPKVENHEKQVCKTFRY